MKIITLIVVIDDFGVAHC